jgi:tryptophanyl-tRNA synthetase
MRSVLFSGSKPTGELTIGNYLGAIKAWVGFQDAYDAVFCVVDLHALSVPQDPMELRERTLRFLCLYAACGLDPARSTVFLQSQNPFHAELAWLLNGCTQYGELTRMTQFKDALARGKPATAGLLNYPVLMAADILLYGAELVPVGADQKQHVELTREIAQRFNARYGETFILPMPFIPSSGARIRSLSDPSRKMDKSSPDPRTYLSLLDGPEAVRAKLQKAKTDSAGTFPIDDESEGIANLVTIYAELAGTAREKVADEYRGRGYGAFKRDLADLVTATLAPIQERYERLRADAAGLERLMRTGAAKAVERSRPMMRRVREAVGLQPGG